MVYMVFINFLAYTCSSTCMLDDSSAHANLALSFVQQTRAVTKR